MYKTKRRESFPKEPKKLTAEEAYHQALRFLEPRFLSCQELTKKLQRKGVDNSVIQSIICKLVDLDYLNDSRLAQQVLKLYMKDAKYGKYYIKQKMNLRGLSVPDFIEDYDEVSAAQKLTRKNFSHVDFSETIIYGDKDPRKKVINFLKNRGFSIGTIQIVLESLY